MSAFASKPPRWCKSIPKVHVSSSMNLGVGSILTRVESGEMYTKAWLFVSSGTDSNTCISIGRGPGGGACDILR